MKSLKILFSVVIVLLFTYCNNDIQSNSEIELWPEIEPYESGYMKVSDIHEIYYELCGNPEGKPVVVLHGGPGVGSKPGYRRFFNPDKFKIIQFDQRGAGKSKPLAELRENTTQHLIQDIESIRQKLEVDKMIVFGGSWGSTLGLAYAETYPENVEAIVLRAVFLSSKEEDENFLDRIAPKFFPYEFEALVTAFPDSLLPPNEKNLFKLLASEDKSVGIKFAKLIDRFEWKACFLYVNDDELDEYYGDESNAKAIYSLALIEHHYMSNGCFLEEGQLLKNAYKIKDIRTIIVNGRYDIVCPPAYAYELHKKLSNSKLIIAEKAGHYLTEKPIERELLLAMREFE